MLACYAAPAKGCSHGRFDTHQQVQPPTLPPLWDRFWTLIDAYRAVDMAGFLGLAVGIVGFAVTLWQLKRTQRAALAAKEAAETTRRNLGHIDALAECAAAIATLEEVRRLHRTKTWPLLPDRYSSLKRSLVTIRATTNLQEENQTRLLEAIGQVTRLEASVENTLANPDGAPDVPRLNKIVSQQIDALAEVLNAVRAQIGG